MCIATKLQLNLNKKQTIKQNLRICFLLSAQPTQTPKHNQTTKQNPQNKPQVVDENRNQPINNN
jgi:hypothetical protein